MHFSTSLFTLPISLILLITNGDQAQAIQNGQSPADWSQNLLREAKFWPGDPPNRRRDVEAKKHLLEEGHAPIGVKKMSGDPNEKFYPEYWAFEEEDMNQAVIGIGSSWALRQGYREEEKELYDNGTEPLSFRPPFPFHTDEDTLSRRDVFERVKDWMEGKDAAGTLALLKKRDFKCVTGTNACVNINQPNLCCGTGETCYSIPDTGLGTVGCCPSGQTCGGSISCASGNLPCLVNNTDGYTGGGCCIPGWVCAGIGCVPQISVVSSTQTTVIAQSSTAVIIVVTKTISPSFTPSTSTTTEIACPTSQFACPVSLGGGCCPSGQSCQVGSCPATTSTTSTTATSITSTSTTTATGVVPVRGTTVSSSTTSTTTSNSLCPTGFYACSATYGGGCCQTGRDCHTTSCPAVASTTIVSSGVTIVVPLTPAATTTASGSCAPGWSSCAPSLGGACCVDGWACGTVSCFSSIGPSQSVAQAKGGVVLNRSARVKGGWGLLVGVVGVVFVGMIVA